MNNAASIPAFELVSVAVYSRGVTRPLVVGVYRSGRRRDGSVFWGACYGHFEVDFYPTREAAIDAVLANLQSRGAEVRNDFAAYALTMDWATKASRYFAE